MVLQVVECLRIKPSQDLCNRSHIDTLSAEVDGVDNQEEEHQSDQDEEILYVEGSADEAPAERLVLQLEYCYHIYYSL